MAPEIPDSVRELFFTAGWRPGRQVRIPAEVRVERDHPAYAVLSSLAGLRVGTRGPGVECARTSLHFGEFDGFDVGTWERRLQTRLVEIAEVEDGNGTLYMDSDGACYSMGLACGRFYLAGPTFAVAVDRLLRGLRFRSELPDDESASL